MKRKLKQFLYGGIYLAVFGLIVWGLFNVFIVKESTCFDLKQNQGETGVDCGGLCESCELKNIIPLSIKGRVQIFELENGVISLLGRVFNSNKNHDSEFSYRFVLYGRSDRKLDTFSEEGFVYADGETLLNSARTLTPNTVQRVELEIFDVEWFRTEKSLRPDILVKNTSTTIVGDELIFGGMAVSNNLISGFDVEIIAVFLDQFGFGIFVSKTVLRNFQSFQERDFEISVPVDAYLMERVDRERTEVYINVQ